MVVFNFWEPLHYLHRGHAFQTWETSPEFSIRSWAYVLLHLWPGKLANFMFGPEKVSEGAVTLNLIRELTDYLLYIASSILRNTHLPGVHIRHERGILLPDSGGQNQLPRRSLPALHDAFQCRNVERISRRVLHSLLLLSALYTKLVSLSLPPVILCNVLQRHWVRILHRTYDLYKLPSYAACDVGVCDWCTCWLAVLDCGGASVCL